MAAYGGMERHICSLAAAAAAEDHEVTLLTTSNSLGPDLREEMNSPLITLRELDIGRGAAGKLTKLAWLVRETLRLKRKSWDIVYTSGQSALARTVWAAASGKSRIIHHHHTAADAGEQQSWSVHFRKVVKLAPELIGCSRTTADALNRAAGRTDATFLPYLTRCPVAESQVIDSEAQSTLNFGFLGRLVTEKGIDIMCRLSQDPVLSDIKWHLHGESPAFPPSYFKDFPNITYHGAYRGTAAQAAILLALDATVLFSTHNEGMPLSLIEAMSAGLPWIATDRGGTREMSVTPDNSIVIPHPANDADIRQGILEMASRIRSGKTSRILQRKAYNAHFAPDHVSRLWLDYFRSKPALPTP